MRNWWGGGVKDSDMVGEAPPTNFKVQGGAMDQLWFGSSKTTSKLARVLYYQTADASTHYGVDTCQALPPNRLAPEGTYLPGPNL